MPITREQRVAQRDKMIHEKFSDLAPVWLINDTYRAAKDSFFFNVVYFHPVHHWINQHLRYDTFNDVLYHMGEARVSEDAVMLLQEQDPYLSGNGISSIPNNPASRY